MVCKSRRSGSVRKSTTRHFHYRRKHKNPAVKVPVVQHPLRYRAGWSGKNTKYTSLVAGHHVGPGQALPGSRGGFNAAVVLDQLENGIDPGFELSEDQKKLIEQEQARRAELKRRDIRTREQYQKLVHEGKAW